MIIANVKNNLLVYSEESILTALNKIESNRHRIVFAVNEHSILQGCITDGDFRRWILSKGNVSLNESISSIINRNCIRENISSNRTKIISRFGNGVELIPLVDDENRFVAIAFNEQESLSFANLEINESSPVFIIAEIGNNHNGNFELAKQLVDHAVESGANCAKFQMRDLNSLYSNSGNKDDHKEDLGSQYTLDLLSRNQLKTEELFRIFDYCHKKKIIPLCTPWDYESLQSLEKYGMEAYKVASADLTNHDFIKQIGETRKPIICSTGMSTEDEIRETVQLIKNLGISAVFLHCNSTYPAPFKDIHLSYLKKLRDITGFVVGYSGHERGYNIALAAVAMGAKIIEKHFTLDKTMEGSDHKVSLLPNEFAEMVKGIREIEESLGNETSKSLSQGEILNRENLAKSLVINRDLAMGEIILEEMIEVKSPGKGLQPNKKKELIGRLAKRNYKKGDFFYQSDLASETVISRNYSFNRKWGLPVRYHDLELMKTKTNLDLVEFHFSYKDLELNPEDYLTRNEEIEFIVHAPELFSGDHVLDLCSTDEKYRNHSIQEMQRVIDLTLKVKKYFPKTQKPLIITNIGGFSFNDFISSTKKSELYPIFKESLGKLKMDGIEIIPQTMPPFPWHFGGQRFHNLFLNPEEIIEFCEQNSFRICLDVSHSKLACNYFHWSFKEFLEKVGKYVAHLHIVDARGIDDEGLQIDDGEIDFIALGDYLEKYIDPSVGFIPEIWQGHKNDGEGFWTALERLEKYFVRRKI